nr:hypothetical protein [Sicyoidochytrium minutum DNA virus]
MTTPSPNKHTEFYQLLVTFLGQLKIVFPAHEGINHAHQALGMFSLETFHPMMSKNWYDTAKPILKEIMARNVDIVATAFNESSVEVIANIKAGDILLDDDVDQDTKDTIWAYIDQLTALSCICHDQPAQAQATDGKPRMARPEEVRVAPPAAAPTGQKKPDFKGMIQTALKSLPDLAKGANEALKESGIAGSGDNPLGDIMKQLMNPDSLQEGPLQNMLANLAGGQPSGAMQEGSADGAAGSDQAEIAAKLARLQKYERAMKKKREKRQGKSG